MKRYLLNACTRDFILKTSTPDEILSRCTPDYILRTCTCKIFLHGLYTENMYSRLHSWVDVFQTISWVHVPRERVLRAISWVDVRQTKYISRARVGLVAVSDKWVCPEKIICENTAPQPVQCQVKIWNQLPARTRATERTWNL